MTKNHHASYANQGHEGPSDLLTDANFDSMVFKFRDRQAGVSTIYDPETLRYSYNAYCMEIKLLAELFTCEYDFLQDALDVVNGEFGAWELTALSDKNGCGSCAAKK